MVLYRGERTWHQQPAEAEKDSKHCGPPSFSFLPVILPIYLKWENSFSSPSVLIALPVTMGRSKWVALCKVQDLATTKIHKFLWNRNAEAGNWMLSNRLSQRQSCTTIHQENNHILGRKWSVTFNRNVSTVQCPKVNLHKATIRLQPHIQQYSNLKDGINSSSAKGQFIFAVHPDWCMLPSTWKRYKMTIPNVLLIRTIHLMSSLDQLRMIFRWHHCSRCTDDQTLHLEFILQERNQRPWYRDTPVVYTLWPSVYFYTESAIGLFPG